MKVLITGPDGILGSNLVRELLNRNYEVSVLILENTSPKTLENLPVHKFYGNILNPQTLKNSVAGHQVVVHCAASTVLFPPRNPIINEINIKGTQNVIDACLSNNVEKLIFVGTANSFANGTTISKPGNEQNTYTGDKYGLDYMDSKYKARELVLDAVKNKNLNAVIVCPTFMLGPYDSKPSSGAMIVALYKRKIPGYTSGGKNFVYVKDVAVAIANAITMGAKGESYILGNENLSFKEAFSKFCTVLNVPPPKVKFNDIILKSYGAISSLLGKVFKFNPTVTKEIAIISCENHFYSSTKAVRELNMPQTPLETAVQDAFDWFKKEGYI